MMGRRTYMVYDVYDGGEFIGKYTVDEIADMLGISKSRVYEASKKETRIGWRYRIEPGLPPNFAKTWTEACNTLKNAIWRGNENVHDCNK